jgi:hypothetical protein
MCRVFLEGFMIIQPVKEIPAFEDYECASHCSKRHEIELNPKIVESVSFYNASLKFLLTIVHMFTPKFARCSVLPLRDSNQILQCISCSAIRVAYRTSLILPHLISLVIQRNRHSKSLHVLLFYFPSVI